jgi:hypothetical protein
MGVSDGIRTRGLLLGKQVLYRLSHRHMEGGIGFEPTSPVGPPVFKTVYRTNGSPPKNGVYYVTPKTSVLCPVVSRRWTYGRWDWIRTSVPCGNLFSKEGRSTTPPPTDMKVPILGLEPRPVSF